MLLEGVHFNLSWTDPRRLGRKSASVNFSDIAAMGGRPRYLLLSLGIPKNLPVEFVDNFMQGIIDRANEFGVSIIGGDTCCSEAGLVISITVLGEQAPDRVIRRTGAAPGDLIFVTGTVGSSAVGLAMLKAGKTEEMTHCVERHLDPSPRVLEGVALADAGVPSAMIDISDGLLSDLGHILERSDAGARIRVDLIPSAPGTAGHLSPDDLLDLVLSGGEDYELLFTAPPSKEAQIYSMFGTLGTAVTRIGEITAEHRLLLLNREGVEAPCRRKGYDHFS
jgi:thiamine-monophosphate kinase